MSKNFTFTTGLTVVVGDATKKTDYDKVAANTDVIKELLKAIP